jgi:hypothetical protein
MSTELQEVNNQTQQLNTIEPTRMSSLSVMTNDEHMERVTKMAKLMASSKVTVPKHLQNNEGDCAAIVMQSMNWGMDPFIVAQKTHLVGSTLGYEAQLVNAVVTSSKAISSPFSYEYKDETGTGVNMSVSCRVGAVIRGQTEITWGEWLSSNSVTTKNSPLWKTNVKQQMGYLQVKNWSRLYAPSAILGVYTADELHDMPVSEKEINARPKTGAAAAEAAKTVSVGAEQVEKRTSIIKTLDGIATNEGLLAYGEAWMKLEKSDRTLVGADEHARLKAIAEATDKSKTFEGVVTGSVVDDMPDAENQNG